MSTMFSSSSGLNKSEITVTSTSQILSGYKDYDSNGNLLTGTNAGYDAGVTQGHSDRDTGVTITDASHIISGYKGRDSSGTLLTGTDAGYNAGVAQGHADRDTGVTVTAASHIISGYKARTSSGALVTGTDAGYTSGYNAGVTKGESNMKSGVTVTSASHIVSGYKARNSSGKLLTGTATTKPTFSTQTITIKVPSGEDRWKTMTGTFSFANECLGITECKNPDGTHNKCLQSVKLGGTKNNTVTITMDTIYSHTGWNWTVTAKGY